RSAAINTSNDKRLHNTDREDLRMKLNKSMLLIILLCLSLPACSNVQEGVDNLQAGQLKGKANEEADMKLKNELVEKGEELFYNKPDNTPSHTSIKIYKGKRILELYGNDKLIGRFKIALGNSPEGDKNKEGDSKTPEGSYYICTRNANSKFTLFLGISYPNTEDAKRGMDNNLITGEIFEAIKTANELKQCPPWNTPLGGEVGIHGGGDTHDWTLGCIALSDENIRIIWDYAPLKTPVEIFE
ncbi:MAG: ErfK/YbiS/YcfS/YnhG family protein, partial [Petrotoga mobilis]